MSSRNAASLAFVAADTPDATEARDRLAALYGDTPVRDSDVMVVLGGDGFMLQTLRDALGAGKPVYGMNRGTVGFLMNEYRDEGLRERIAAAVRERITPLSMTARSEDGTTTQALAFNEVSLLRQSYQAAKIRIMIDGRLRLDELVCDGVMWPRRPGPPLTICRRTVPSCRWTPLSSR